MDSELNEEVIEFQPHSRIDDRGDGEACAMRRLKHVSAFSLFRDIHTNDMPYNRKHMKCDYRVFDLNNRVIFYVRSTTRNIEKGAAFCLKLYNKDYSQVAKFLRAVPRGTNTSKLCFGCFQSTRDELQILDEHDRLMSTWLLLSDFFRGVEMKMKDNDDRMALYVRTIKDNVFNVYDYKDRFVAEIRQKVTSSSNATDNYKGVSCWFPETIATITKLHLLGAAFLLEIDLFGEPTHCQRAPFHVPESDYLIPVIKTPPYHERVRKLTTRKKVVINKSKTSLEGKKDTAKSPITDKESKAEVMPFIAHARQLIDGGGASERQENEKSEKGDNEIKDNNESMVNARNGIDRELFKRASARIIEYVTKQDETLRDHRCTPTVRPGYLRPLIAAKPPQEPEDLEDILDDYNKLIVPGLIQSSHPNFHGAYPSGNPYPCLLSELLAPHAVTMTANMPSTALNELEVIMMDWLGEAMGLPRELLLFPDGSRGGGCMKVSQADANFLVLIAARNAMLTKLRMVNKESDLNRLVAYTSSEAHYSIIEAAKQAMVMLRILKPDENLSLRGSTLQVEIMKDVRLGNVPFFVCATFGTPKTCAFDNVTEMGTICRERGLWLHVDASYAGTAMICPETRHLMKGLDSIDSFCTTPSKVGIAICDVTCLWVRDRFKLESACRTFDEHYDLSTDGRTRPHWAHNLPVSQRFSSLRMWFILRISGIEMLQKQIRQHIKLGTHMASIINSDGRFKMCNYTHLGVICFRAAYSDNVNRVLIHRLNETGKIYLTEVVIKNMYAFRLCVNTPKTTEEDLETSFKLICQQLDQVLSVQHAIDQLCAVDLEEYLRPGSKKKKDKQKKTLSSESH